MGGLLSRAVVFFFSNSERKKKYSFLSFFSEQGNRVIMYILYRYILLHMSSVCVRGNIGFVGGIFSFFFEGNVDFLFKLFGHLLRPESSWVAIFPQTFHFLYRIYCLFSLKKEGGGGR